jgi:hypothetical protein
MSESAAGAGALDAQAVSDNGTAPGPSTDELARREADEAETELAGMRDKLAQAEADHERAKELLEAAEARHAAAQQALGNKDEGQ